MTKNTKKAVWASALSILMCLSLLIGTTFAWFTDTANTAVNKIQAGTLDVELQYKDNDGNWVDAENVTLQFKVNGAIPAADTQILWEPGCTYELPALRVVNKGDLALKYKVEITGINGDAKLNEAIEWTINNAPINLTEQILAVGGTGAAFVIKGHMKEDAGNEYQGLSIDGIGITVYAAQYVSETDSNDNQYDADATYPIEILAVIKDAEMTNQADGSFTYANSDNTVTASIPNGITIAEGKKPEVNVAPINGGNITTTADGKNAIGYDISIANVTLGDTLAKVSFKLGTGLQNVTMKHNGVAMTNVAPESALTANNTFYYDETSGMVTIAVSSFSPFTAEFDAPVASIGGKAYYSLQEAFNVGGEIVLQSDVAIPTTKITAADRLTIKKATTLNFNGHKIVAPGELEPTPNWAALFVAADTVFNADEKGGIVCPDKKNGECGTYAVNVIGGASLTVNGGTYYGGGTVFQVQLGNLTINGGSFAATSFGEPYNYDYFLNCVDANYKDGTATITVKGGSFKNFNPADNKAEGANTNFVAEGYAVVYGDDSYVVTELNTALAAGGTVKLASGLVTAQQIVIPEGVTATLDLNGKTVESKFGGYSIANYGTLTVNDSEGTGLVFNSSKEAVIVPEINGYYGHDAIRNFGNLTINGGRFGDNNADQTDANGSTYGAAVRNQSGATCVINGGYFTCLDNYGYFSNGDKVYSYAIRNYGDMTINNATVYGKMNGGVAADGGKIVINGGNFSLDGTNTYYVLVTGSGSIEVNGGTFTRTGANRLLGGFNGMPSWDATGDLAANRYTVTGGTFTVNGETVTLTPSSEE